MGTQNASIHRRRCGHSDAALRTGYLGGMGLLLPAVLFTQVDSLTLSIGLLAIAMFFASFPLSTSAQSMQILAPNQLRAQVSALFLLVSNLIGLGVGTTVVALITDNVFGSPLLVGHSIAVVNLVASLLTIGLLMRGCRHFRHSMAQEHGTD